MAAISSLADLKTIEQVPLAERNLPTSTYNLFERVAASNPNDLALSFFLQGTDYKNSVTFNFRQLLAGITQAANLFHSLGVGPNDTVSYILPNLPQTYFTLYGGEAAGIANPINPLLEPHVLAEIMTAANTKVLVTIAPFPRTDIWEKVASIADQVPTLQTILQIDIAGYLSGIKKLVVQLMRLRGGAPKPKARVLSFDKEMAKQPSDRLVSGRQIKPDEVASYFHTGGTTGTPKLAKHTHANEVFDGWAVNRVIEGGPGEVNFLGLPLFHNYGAIAVGLGSWIGGAAVTMGTPSGFRGEGVVENFWHILDHYNCTIFAAVPTLFKALLNVPIGDADLSKLKMATCGAAPLPVELARQFTEMTGVQILEGYGLTEGTSVNSVNPPLGEVRIGSVGFPLPYQEMAVAIANGPEFVRFAEPEEVGVIVLRGPNVFPGYLDDFHNQGLFFDAGDGGDPWLNTGDLGRMDEDGYFWLTGRKKELIIRGGHNIDPKQIEEPLHRHPAVALAAAVGRPDPRVGEMPVAYVELKPGTNATPDDILSFARDNIGERAAVPKEVYILDAIPLTAVGKIFKPELARAQVKDVYEAELAQVKGVASAQVVAEGDKRLGTVAYVRVTAEPSADKAALEKDVRSALGQYTVHFDLKIV